MRITTNGNTANDGSFNSNYSLEPASSNLQEVTAASKSDTAVFVGNDCDDGSVYFTSYRSSSKR